MLQLCLGIWKLSWLSHLTASLFTSTLQLTAGENCFPPLPIFQAWLGLHEQYFSLMITDYRFGVKCQLNSKSLVLPFTGCCSPTNNPDAFQGRAGCFFPQTHCAQSYPSNAGRQDSATYFSKPWDHTGAQRGCVALPLLQDFVVRGLLIT